MLIYFENCGRMIGHVTLVAITGATKLVSAHCMESLQLVWRSGMLILRLASGSLNELRWLHKDEWELRYPDSKDHWIDGD